MKRILATLLVVVLVFSLAACDKKDNNTAGTGNNTTTNAPSSSSEGLTKDTKADLEMWCIATESDSNRKSYENAIADMQAAYPNVNFKWEAFENESYKTRSRQLWQLTKCLISSLHGHVHSLAISLTRRKFTA